MKSVGVSIIRLQKGLGSESICLHESKASKEGKLQKNHDFDEIRGFLL